MMAKSKKKADWEFIFDGVFGFLSSPIWQVPMMSFIDTQCLVFEPSEENHLEWTTIHKNYGVLVESLLAGYLKDVGISEKDFLKACMSAGAQPSEDIAVICEQLFAAEDFEIFKKMMTQRNVELELEALKLIKRRQSSASGGKEKVCGDKGKNQSPVKKAVRESPTEDEILAEVIKRSEEEYRQLQKNQSAEDVEYNENLERIIAASLEESWNLGRLEQEVVTKQTETKRTVQEHIKADTTSGITSDTTSIGKDDLTQESGSKVGKDLTQKVSTISGQAVAQVIAKPVPETTKGKVISSNTATDNTATASTAISKETTISSNEPEKTVSDSTQEKKNATQDATSTASPSSLKNNKLNPMINISQSPQPSPPLSPLKGLEDKSRLPSIPLSAADQWLQDAKDENAAGSSDGSVRKKPTLSDEDIKKREEYLKKQRDLIQKMKNQEREKQLLSYTKDTAGERPVSARVAREAVSGGGGEKMSEGEEKQLAMRRLLAEKLKKQVVYKDAHAQ